MSLPEVYTCGNCVHSAAGTNFIFFGIVATFWRFEACLSRTRFPDAPAREKLNTYQLRRQSD